MPVLGVKDWAPFKLDALGIITLLGTESLRQSISRLVLNRFVEYLPLLAPHIIADNTITDVVPGFTLYNITDGVLAIDLSGWWTRWLICQAFNWNTTVLEVRTSPPRRSLITCSWLVMLCFNVIINIAIIVIPALLDDWYGLAASISLVVTVISRAYVLSSLRRSVDDLATVANKDPSEVKLFLTFPNGTAVTIRTTRGITKNILLTTPQPKHRLFYKLFRAIDWVALGVLVVSLGSASLVVQILLIGILLFATLVVVQRYGCDELHIGQRLEITQSSLTGEDRRGNAYINLSLTEEEEKAMISWHLLPMLHNKFLWDRYNTDKGTANQLVFHHPVSNITPIAEQNIIRHPTADAAIRQATTV
ncbi:hypothetical protein F4860DRAFT_515548 [Xylaria cubensis]|nr:hypothetical protein F4860DRAFT_515548 [Xylaria cubensis]